jgi:hypothetical protein
MYKKILNSSKGCFLIVFIFVMNLVGFKATAQSISSNSTDTGISAVQREILYDKKQRDLADYALIILHKNPDTRFDSAARKITKLHISAAPITEYALSSGFAVGFAGIAGFVTSGDGLTNTSSYLAAIKYTQDKQFLIPIQSSVWTKDNKYNLQGDWRYLNYPQETYGFGGFNPLASGYIVDYKYIRFHQYGLKNIGTNFYAGFGYQLDYHWNITEENVQPGRVTDFQKYGFNKTSASSGFALNILYDSRKSSINPEGGSFYTNIILLQNSTLLGSNSNWNSATIDIRKYIKLPHNNVLAFWSYNVFTLSGNPPYLDLPGTGTDTYNNTGRGYIEDRFIGKNMIDLEAELRYGITHNGLLGGVIFANAESLSELNTNKFEVISPALGAGLRIKFNKFSNTNICIDYGVGADGSHGFFGNLGEVF